MHATPSLLIESHPNACLQGGELESSLLCEVGAEIGRRLPGRLKRKELFEAHAVACLVKRHARRHSYAPDVIVDLCAGCGLLGLFLALMYPRARVIAMDRTQSALSQMLSETAVGCWPELRDRLSWILCDMRPKAVGNEGSLALPPSCIVVACHACGLLTDEAIAVASHRRLRPMILLPCCYVTHPRSRRSNPGRPSHSWERLPWLKEGAVNREGEDSIDDARVAFLQMRGYKVNIDHIDPQITRYNKAICAFPAMPERALKPDIKKDRECNVRALPSRDTMRDIQQVGRKPINQCRLRRQ